MRKQEHPKALAGIPKPRTASEALRNAQRHIEAHGIARDCFTKHMDGICITAAVRLACYHRIPATTRKEMRVWLDATLALGNALNIPKAVLYGKRRDYHEGSHIERALQEWNDSQRGRKAKQHEQRALVLIQKAIDTLEES